MRHCRLRLHLKSGIPSPKSLQLQILWNLIKYNKKPDGTVCFDSKNTPIEPPYNDMVFKGYAHNKKDNVIACKFV